MAMVMASGHGWGHGRGQCPWQWPLPWLWPLAMAIGHGRCLGFAGWDILFPLHFFLCVKRECEESDHEPLLDCDRRGLCRTAGHPSGRSCKQRVAAEGVTCQGTAGASRAVCRPCLRGSSRRTRWRYSSQQVPAARATATGLLDDDDDDTHRSVSVLLDIPVHVYASGQHAC